MLNKRIGSLTVISDQILVRSGTRNRPYRFCICACGTKKRFREDNLLSGKTTSCGCTKVRMSVDQYKEYKNFGLTDKEIAKKEKVSLVTLHKWKKKNNIIGQFQKNYKERATKNLLQEEYDVLKEKGLTDYEIAELKKIHFGTFLHWKSRNNIQQKERVRKRTLDTFTVKEYETFKRNGLKDSEIADKLFVNLDTLNRWKFRNDLRRKKIQNNVS